MKRQEIGLKATEIYGNTYGHFVIHFSLLLMVQGKHKSFLHLLVLLEQWAVDTLSIPVHKFSYLDTTKTLVENQASFPFLFWIASPSMEDCFWNFPSYLAKWSPLFSYLCFLNIWVVFDQMY